MNTEPKSNGTKLAATIGLIVIVAAIAVGVAAFSPKKTATTIATSPTPTPTSDTLGATATPAAAASSYKDGTYSASGNYESPGGQETVSLKVTLSGGTVTDSTVTTTGNTPTGKQYQGEFIASYKSFVTGKNIDTIKLSKVSGSSLTSEGFNNALAKIKTEAKA